jgi:hypothetical protein
MPAKPSLLPSVSVAMPSDTCPADSNFTVGLPCSCSYDAFFSHSYSSALCSYMAT